MRIADRTVSPMARTRSFVFHMLVAEALFPELRINLLLLKCRAAALWQELSPSLDELLET
jgi:hypothetical protein